jgi:hypothetical protein
MFCGVFAQSSWVRYIPQGYELFNMNDIVSVGSDLIASGDDQLYYLNDSTIITCTTIPSRLITKTAFSWIQPRSNGEIWCFGNTAGSKFRRYKFGDFQQLDTVNLPPSTLTATLELRNGTLIGSTDKSGMYLCKGEKWEPLEGSPQEAGFKPRLEDRDGNIWFSGNGVRVWNPATNIWTSYSTDNSPLTTSNITDIVDDRNGNIIIAADCFFSTDASLIRGIFVKRGTSWTKYDTVNTGMPSVDVLCLARDSTGNIWFGSRYGVIKWDGNSKWEYMCRGAINIHQPFGFIRAITVDTKNRVWVAAFHVGFFMLDQNGSGCSPKIKMTYPVSGTVVKQKTIFAMTWEYEGPVGAIKIEQREGTGTWTSIRENVDNNRKYNWYTNALPTSSSYQIRISSVDNPAVFDTSARFTIADSGANIPPELTPFPDTFEVKTNQKTTFTVHANDADKDTLRFSYSTLPSWVTVKDSVLTFEPQTGSQSFTLKASVSDGKGNAVQDSMVVLVSVITGSNRTMSLNSGCFRLQRNKQRMIMLSTENLTEPIQASMYDLSGKKVGDFISRNNQYVFGSKMIRSTGLVYIIVVRSIARPEIQPFIEKVIIQ